MQCPECDADETEERAGERQLKNLGGKRYYRSCNTRRYECRSCGHHFLSVETPQRAVAVRQPLPTPSDAD
jgi:rubredoxin